MQIIMKWLLCVCSNIDGVRACVHTTGTNSYPTDCKKSILGPTNYGLVACAATAEPRRTPTGCYCLCYCLCLLLLLLLLLKLELTTCSWRSLALCALLNLQSFYLCLNPFHDRWRPASSRTRSSPSSYGGASGRREQEDKNSSCLVAMWISFTKKPIL